MTPNAGITRCVAHVSCQRPVDQPRDWTIPVVILLTLFLPGILDWMGL